MQVCKPHSHGCVNRSAKLRGLRGSVVPHAVQADSIAQWIKDNMDAGKVVKEQFVSSSSWSSAYIYTTASGQSFFSKTALGRSAEDMFAGEALGLQAMYDTRTIRVPKVFYYGDFNGGRSSFIVMEHLKMSGRSDPAEFGRKLAQMHMAEPTIAEAKAGQFGFPVDNTIGGTSQPNGWMDNWVEFFRTRRLQHQLRLANDRRLNEMGEKLLDNLGVFFEGVEGVRPSVLHGDLWSGNIAAVDSEACIFDPAVYYGHHEAEFGMSWCASFGPAFYEGYHSVIPKATGFEDRKQLYTLYHILNHYNLFGGGYYSQCVDIMSRLLKRI